MAEEIDLGREVSHLLTEVRTVLSRAETALGDGGWISRAEFAIVRGRWTYRPSHPEYVEPVTIPHPDRDEIRVALEQVVELLSPWRKTGRPTKR